MPEDQELTQERADGPTPNGGAYSIAYFRNDLGQDVTKDAATRIDVVEYSAEGVAIFHTLLVRNCEEAKANEDDCFFE